MKDYHTHHNKSYTSKIPTGSVGTNYFKAQDIYSYKI